MSKNELSQQTSDKSKMLLILAMLGEKNFSPVISGAVRNRDLEQEEMSWQAETQTPSHTLATEHVWLEILF